MTGLTALLLALLPSAVFAAPAPNPVPEPGTGVAHMVLPRGNMDVSLTSVHTWRDGSHLGKRAAGDGQLDSVFWDMHYALTLSMGTPAQDIPLRIVTSGGSVIVATSNCSDCTEVRSTERFSVNSSSSWAPTMSLDAVLGTASVKGVYGKEQLSLGGYPLNYEIFALDGGNMSQQFFPGTGGELGLGLAKTGDGLSQAYGIGGPWPAPYFGVYLGRHDTTPASNNADTIMTPNTGKITLGGTDPGLYTGSINFVPSQPNTFAITLDQLKIGSQVIVGRTENVTVNTGSGYMGAPPGILSRIMGNIPGSSQMTTGATAGQYRIPCDVSVELVFTIGGQDIKIMPADLRTWFDPAEPNMCFANFYTTPNIVLGVPFLHNVYTVFQVSPAQVGFAPLAANLQFTNGSATATVTTGPPVGTGGASGGNANTGDTGGVGGGGGGSVSGGGGISGGDGGLNPGTTPSPSPTPSGARRVGASTVLAAVFGVVAVVILL